MHLTNYFLNYKFFRSFLDGLYAVADLMLEPRPDPKPPDIDIPDDETTSSVQPSTVGGELQFLIRFESIISIRNTWTKKRSFDFFVKRRRKKYFFSFLVFYQ